MLDWSNKKGLIDTESSSLAEAYVDLLHIKKTTPPPKKSPLQSYSDQDLLKPENMKLFLEQKIKNYGLHDLILIKQDYTPQTWEDMNRDFVEYYKIRKMFLKMIGYSCAEECQNLGFSTQEIELMKQGISPENFNTHMKIPTEFGGKLSLDNMALVQTNRSHGRIHRLLDIQIEKNFLKANQSIFIPFFEGKFYYD